MSKNIIYVEYQVPFCASFECKFIRLQECTLLPGDTLWDSMSKNCKINIIIYTVFLIVLSILTSVFNALNLKENLSAKTRRLRKRNPTMRNYSTYVISLAVSDFVIGALVLPLCIISLYLHVSTNQAYNTNKIESICGNNWSSNVYLNEFRDSNKSIGLFNIIEPHFKRKVDILKMDKTIKPLFNVPSTLRFSLGFSTHLALFASMYTIVAASADRFYSATNAVRVRTKRWSYSSPISESGTISLRRKIINALTQSRVAVAAVWVVGAIFAIIPLIMNPQIEFRYVGHIFVAMSSKSSQHITILWYVVLLGIPLLTIWLFNLMICYALWKRKRQRNVMKRQNSFSKRKKASYVTDVTTKTPTQEVARSSKRVKIKFTLQKSLTGDKVHKTSRKNDDSKNLEEEKCNSRGIKRRRMSSVRRARVFLRSQSYEGNITKTLVVVVVAFTIAVFPLIVCLCHLMRTTENNSTMDTWNSEVTALVLSTTLLFLNSFANSMIYGSKPTITSKIILKLFEQIRMFCFNDKKNREYRNSYPHEKVDVQRMFRRRCQTMDENILVDRVEIKGKGPRLKPAGSCEIIRGAMDNMVKNETT